MSKPLIEAEEMPQQLRELLKKYLAPPAIVVWQRSEKPTCGRKDCDIAENPEHWVDAELVPRHALALKLFPEAVGLLAEVYEVCNSNFRGKARLGKRIEKFIKKVLPIEREYKNERTK